MEDDLLDYHFLFSILSKNDDFIDFTLIVWFICASCSDQSLAKKKMDDNSGDAEIFKIK